MARYKTVLRDATDDLSAHERANHAPELTAALSDLGFHSIGVIELTVSDPSRVPAAYRGIDPVDAQKLIEIVQQGEAVEVMASRDVLMFGIVERTVTSPVISFQTILENGVVVETTMRPERAPHPVGSTSPNALVRNLSALNRLPVGDPPIWPRANRPASGFYVELVRTRDAKVLYSRHIERLKNIREQYHAAIPRQDSLEVYRAIHTRFRRVARRQWYWSLTLSIFIAMMMAAAVFFLPRQNSLMDILFIIEACLLALLAIGLVNRFIVPEIGTPLESLKRLLKQQSAEWCVPNPARVS